MAIPYFSDENNISSFLGNKQLSKEGQKSAYEPLKYFST